MRTTLILTAVMLACGALPGAAQTATPALDALRAEAPSGKTVYLTDLSGTRVKGRVVTISEQSIELLVHGRPREWRTADIAWISERHRHPVRGTVIGLAIGAVFGAGLVMTDCGNVCDRTDLGMALMVAGLFGGIGGGAGAAIGAVTRSEHVLYVGPNRQTRNRPSPLTAGSAVGVRAQLRF